MKSCFWIIVLVAAVPAAAAPPVTWPSLPQPTNIRVRDGDTLVADFPGIPAVFGKSLGIRLLGIDTPELRDPNPVVKAYALQARDYLVVRVRTAKRIEIRSPARDKFFRMNGAMFLDGVDIQQELLSRGYAKPYKGGTKIPWTEADVIQMQKLNAGK